MNYAFVLMHGFEMTDFLDWMIYGLSDFIDWVLVMINLWIKWVYWLSSCIDWFMD